jgi:hypothetical protein
MVRKCPREKLLNPQKIWQVSTFAGDVQYLPLDDIERREQIKRL